MPELVLPAEADHCPYCNEVLLIPPKCCDQMIAEYNKQRDEELANLEESGGDSCE